MCSLLCCYGCGLPAIHQNKSGRWMCETSPSRCPIIRSKNSKGVKGAYDSGKRQKQKDVYKNICPETKSKMAWNRGLTKKTDARVNQSALNAVGRRKTTDEQKIRKIEYYEKTKFNLVGTIHKVDGYELLVKYGMYNRKTNPGGVVRDHIISKNFGFKNNIDPYLLSHPANCRFIFQIDNAKKSSKSLMTIEDLLLKIENWKALHGHDFMSS